MKGWHILGVVTLLFFSPLVGVVYLDLQITQYLEFPPRTKYIAHASFSWVVFFGLFLCVACICFPFLHRLITYSSIQQSSKKKKFPFPCWGWLGIGCVLISWVLAWNRFAFFAPLQRYTFSPIWFGYILVVNALTYRNSGSCLLSSQSRFFLLLFPVSTLFWWYFEYLNRFVQNWYYIGGTDISAVEYVVHASICFSTVLPAVFSTHEFISTFPQLKDAFINWHRFRMCPGKGTGWFVLALSVAPLATLAVFPDYLFPMVWVSPLLVIVGIQLVRGQKNIFTDLQKGDWRHIVLPSLTALVCGFFWEMWNWKSLAHWEYSIPFVHRFEIFAMPLLGYAGYMPFGLVCVQIGSLVRTND